MEDPPGVDESTAEINWDYYKKLRKQRRLINRIFRYIFE
jgi:hypothetical protein